MQSPRPFFVAATLAAATLIGACADGDARSSTSPATTATAGGRSTSQGLPVWILPAQHPSDWAAPAATLPAAPLPFGPSPRPTADAAFYDVSRLDPGAVAAASPGEVLRVESAGELGGSLRGRRGWRILYRSTLRDGSPTVVSGFVIAPDGDPPSGGWPVAAWAHGTTGIADRCAPSGRTDLFYPAYADAAANLIAAGFVVSATDYVGLGTPGVHSYLQSEELARATLDSVRAAGAADPAVSTDGRFVVVGHSEGGQAALAADERSSAASGLTYLGAVPAAPSTQLGRVAPATLAIEGRGYGALILEALAEEYPDLAPDVALGPTAAARRALLTHGCWEEAVPGFDDIDPFDMVSSPDVGDRLGAALEDWARLDPTAAVGPLLVVQGLDDESVPEPLTADSVARLCAAGVIVDYITYPGAQHDPVLAAAAADIRTWLTDRLAGRPAPNSCPPGAAPDPSK